MSDDSEEKFDQRSDLWSSELEEDDENTEEDERAAGAKDTTGDMDDVNAMDATDTQKAKDTTDHSDEQSATEWDVDSIRESWPATNVRLPESIRDPFNAQHKRLDWQLDRVESDVQYTKDRYYKPLVIALGLRQLQSLEPEEVAELLEEMEHGDLLDE